MTTSRSTGLRRSVLDHRARNKAKGKGGWKGSWRDRLDVPKAEGTDILLTRGEYENPADIDEETQEMRYAHFHTSVQHSVSLGRSGPGSFYMSRCGLDAGEEDCLPCLRMQQGDRRISSKNIYSFNVIHLAIHERVPVLEENGRPKLYEQGDKRGEPMMEWQRVDRPKRRKAILEDFDSYYKAEEAVLFRKKYIEASVSYRDDISTIDEKAARFCRCGGDLSPVCFTCEKCNAVLSDVEEDDMTAEQVLEFASRRERCPDCAHVGLPVPEMVCTLCTKPQPLTAFDVVATIVKEGEKTGSHIVVLKVVPLDEYKLPTGESLIEWKKRKDGSSEPVFDAEGNFVFTEDYDFRKAATSQWDFNTVLAPRDHAYHAQRLQVDNPFRATSGAGKYKNYDTSGRPPASRTRMQDEEAPATGRGRRGAEPEEEEEEEEEGDPESAPPARGARGGREDRTDRGGRGGRGGAAPRQRGAYR